MKKTKLFTALMCAIFALDTAVFAEKALPSFEVTPTADSVKAGETVYVLVDLKDNIYLGYFDTDNDSNQYQGNQYDVICIDEATQFTEHMFSVLTACLRGVNNFPKRMYLTCNPGGIGHDWVKRLFVSKR